MRDTHYATLGREDRQFTFETVELRADERGESLTFDGVASVVDTPYTVRDMFGEFEETIRAGAFKKTLREKDDIRLLVNHEGIPLARRRGSKGDTLSLSEEPHLRATAPLDAASPLVQTVKSAMSRGDMDQMSIGMRVMRQEWNEDYTERQIIEARLFDVSLVTFPASTTTTAALRSVDELIATLPADLDEAELRRAIAHLESLLPTEERAPVAMHPELVEAQMAAMRRRAA